MLECVGSKPALDMALGVVRDGGAISGSACPSTPKGCSARTWSCATSPSPVKMPRPRAYIEELLPDVLEGRIEPGRVFDRTVSLDQVPGGYRAMADQAPKVLIQP